jgi:hypothetical protein
MRGLFTLLGLLTVVLGAFLALQGFGLFPGKSVMNGDHKWALYGACLALGGMVLMAWARGPSRRRDR